MESIEAEFFFEESKQLTKIIREIENFESDFMLTQDGEKFTRAFFSSRSELISKLKLIDQKFGELMTTKITGDYLNFLKTDLILKRLLILNNKMLSKETPKKERILFTLEFSSKLSMLKETLEKFENQ